jgi:hypothetical protein
LQCKQKKEKQSKQKQNPLHTNKYCCVYLESVFFSHYLPEFFYNQKRVIRSTFAFRGVGTEFVVGRGGGIGI